MLNVTQPALTMQVRRLEEALGVTLFDRDTRSVELTRVGRDLMPAFERTLEDFEAALGSARDIATQARGIVRLASLPSVAASVLPDAILSFRQKRPNVVFDLKDVIAGQVLNLVQSEQVDFGVMGGAVKAPDAQTIFEAQDRLYVIYPKGHEIGRLKAVTPAALAEFPLILMQRDTSVRAIVETGFHAAGLMPKATCEAIYMMTAVGMVRAGTRVDDPSRLRSGNQSGARPSVATDRRPHVHKTGFRHQETGQNASAAKPSLPRAPLGLYRRCADGRRATKSGSRANRKEIPLIIRSAREKIRSEGELNSLSRWWPECGAFRAGDRKSFVFSGRMVARGVRKARISLINSLFSANSVRDRSINSGLWRPLAIVSRPGRSVGNATGEF